MYLLLIMALMLMMLFPFLLLPIALFIVIGFLFLLPYVWAFNSFYNVFTIPWQIIKIAKEPKTRKNHSLEHATINVLEEIYGRPLRIGGLADANGFSISGPDLPMPYEILAATREGQSRLASGERDLALHPRCGTSIAAANFLFSLVFVIVLICYNHLSFLNAALAFLLSNLLAKPFGLYAQRWFTTSSDVSNVEVLGIEIKTSSKASPFAILLTNQSTYFVTTRQW
jgi:uncharacterized protein YqhQ